MMSEKLKECPFCGGEACIEDISGNYGREYRDPCNDPNLLIAAKLIHDECVKNSSCTNCQLRDTGKK